MNYAAPFIQKLEANRRLLVLWCAVALTAVWPVPGEADFELDLELTDAVIEAIDEGIEIHIVAQIKLLRVRPWIWDQSIGEWKTGFRLKYHDLSSTYVLTEDATGELESFTTIRDALDSLADVKIVLPVVTDTLPKNPDGYRVSVKIDIDRGGLPPPLRLITDISPAWQLGSRWKQWTVAQ